MPEDNKPNLEKPDLGNVASITTYLTQIANEKGNDEGPAEKTILAKYLIAAFTKPSAK